MHSLLTIITASSFDKFCFEVVINMITFEGGAL